MKNEREIDLVELYIKLLSFIKRRFLIIAVISLAGLLLGAFRHYTAPARYRVIMIASSQIVDKQYLLELANPIMMYIEQREYNDLATYLDCDEKALSTVKSMEIDTSLLFSIKFSLIFSDSSSIGDFRNAMINFYNNQRFINGLYENEKNALNEFVKVIDAEIDELNEFQARILKDDISANDIKIYTSLSGSHEELINLYEKRYALRGKMAQTQPISFITDDMVMQKRNSLLISLLIWGGMFFVISLLLSVYLDLRREAKIRKSATSQL